jgi:hypothetical protein
MPALDFHRSREAAAVVSGAISAGGRTRSRRASDEVHERDGKPERLRPVDLVGRTPPQIREGDDEQDQLNCTAADDGPTLTLRQLAPALLRAATHEPSLCPVRRPLSRDRSSALSTRSRSAPPVEEQRRRRRRSYRREAELRCVGSRRLGVTSETAPFRAKRKLGIPTQGRSAARLAARCGATRGALRALAEVGAYDHSCDE